MLYSTALVTGASAGFGRAICKSLVKDGLKVIACARREDKLQSLRDELGEALLPVVLDVTDNEAIDRVLSSLPDGFKDIDVLVNNAGLALGLNKIQDSTMADMQIMLDTNIKGLVAMTAAVSKSMMARNKGFIINLGSIAGDWPYTGGNIYGASKAFVAQFSRNLRTDFHGSAIKVCCIKPGLCSDTEFSYVRFAGDEGRVKATYDNVEAITPEDIASLVSYLVSLPRHVNINDIEMMPVAQCYAGPAVVKGDIFTNKG